MNIINDDSIEKNDEIKKINNELLAPLTTTTTNNDDETKNIEAVTTTKAQEMKIVNDLSECLLACLQGGRGVEVFMLDLTLI